MSREQRTFSILITVCFVAGVSLVAGTGAAAALEPTFILINAQGGVEGGETFDASVSSVNWGDSVETYEHDPCYGFGVDLDRVPDISTGSGIELVSSGSWEYAGGVVGYRYTASFEAVESGNQEIRFDVHCNDGSSDLVVTTVTVEGVDEDDGPTGDDDGSNLGGENSGIDRDWDSGEEEDSGGDSRGIVSTVIDGMTDEGRGSMVGMVKDAIISVIFEPFRVLVHELITAIVSLIAWTPDVYPNPAVEDVHQQTLAVAIMMALLGFLAAGLLYQTGPLFGISFSEVRVILPRLIIAVVFASISLPILQLFVDLTNALTLAFQPPLNSITLGSIFGTAVAGLLVWVINAFVLLAVALMYIIRDVYLLFIAGISPLIAVAWAMPRTRKYAQALISGWWVALAMGPMAMIVLTFVFALMSGSGESTAQTVGNWLYGVAGFVLLLFLPFQLYGAATMITGMAFRTTSSIERGLRARYPQVRERLEDREWGNVAREFKGRRNRNTSIYADNAGDRENMDVRTRSHNHPGAREYWDIEQRMPRYAPPRRTEPDANRKNRFADILEEEPGTEPRFVDESEDEEETGGEGR